MLEYRNTKAFLLKDILQIGRIEKVTKRKGNKLYVKWKGYDNSFNSWVDKKKY